MRDGNGAKVYPHAAEQYEARGTGYWTHKKDATPGHILPWLHTILRIVLAAGLIADCSRAYRRIDVYTRGKGTGYRLDDKGYADDAHVEAAKRGQAHVCPYGILGSPRHAMTSGLDKPPLEGGKFLPVGYVIQGS